jgi:hypothetical protein
MFTVLRKGFLILFAIVLLGLTVGVALGADALFERALRAWGPHAFGGQPIAFSDAELAIFGGRANVSDFRAGTDEYPLLELERGGLEVGVGAALAGRVHVRNAELVGTRLHLIVREDGTLAFDPGPPPPEVEPGKPPPPRERPLPKAENRDLVQIVAEYWERYQAYKEYYDKYGGIFSGGADEDAEPPPPPTRFPGKPDFVAAAQERRRVERAARGAFWLERAAIEDFRWETLDQRNGQPLLPELKGFTFALEHLGTPPGGETMPATVRGEGELADGGAIGFRLDLARDGGDSALEFRAVGVPTEALVALAKNALPFQVSGGALDVVADGLRFRDEALAGRVRVELRGVNVQPRRISPQVLGVDAAVFCQLLNDAMARAPVAFSIVLGGTPTRPTFDVENETDLGELLGGAVKAEVRRRAEALIDEQAGRLQEKAGEVLNEKLGGKLDGVLGDDAAAGLGGALGDKAKESLGGLLGGEKPKDAPKPPPKPKEKPKEKPQQQRAPR